MVGSNSRRQKYPDFCPEGSEFGWEIRREEGNQYSGITAAFGGFIPGAYVIPLEGALAPVCDRGSAAYKKKSVCIV